MSTQWIIKDADGNIVNSILANEDHVKANYEYYEVDNREVPQLNPTEEENVRRWRDSELVRTDLLLLLPDHPDKDNLTTYRQELRDWPSTSEFPSGTKPTLGS
jgi:hypothetical protein